MSSCNAFSLRAWLRLLSVVVMFAETLVSRDDRQRA